MNKIALITGAARRVGAAIAKALHQQNINVVIHYHHSKVEAEQLVLGLNSIRPHSAYCIQGDINSPKDCQRVIAEAYEVWQQLDILVNNASSFYPTPIGQATEIQWEDLIGSNVKGPFFLSQAAAGYLKETKGNIINIADIHADRPLKEHTIYCIAKAGVVMLTKSLARELGPDVRVNAIAPGAILWPNEDDLSDSAKTYIINRTLLKRIGSPEDIAQTAIFLTQERYITGQVIAVDGGRSVRD